MDYLYIGVIVNTHGIKGEVRIISDFEYKDKIFNINNNLYIGETKEELKIVSYRKHKNYDMVMFEGIEGINEVLKYKGKKVYFNKKELKLNENEILDRDLIGIDAFFNEKNIGKLKEVINNNGYKILDIDGLLIPYNPNFIENINLKEERITLKNIEELLK